MTTPTDDFGQINRLIHEPSRMAIMGVLASIEQADFKYLLGTTGLTKGNLSRHLTKLEDAGYVEIIKTFVGKMPKT